MEACSSANDWSRQFKKIDHEMKLISLQYVAPYCDDVVILIRTWNLGLHPLVCNGFFSEEEMLK